jgi:YggT family protein
LRAIISWFALDPRNPLVEVLDQITEPILSPLRRIVPRIGMIDITPLVAIILLQVLSQAVAQSL